MPIPRSIDLLGQIHQRTVTRTHVSLDRLLHEDKTPVARRRLVEKHGERRVAFSRLLPHAEVVHEFLSGRRRALDFLLRFVGPGNRCERGGFA